MRNPHQHIMRYVEVGDAVRQILAERKLTAHEIDERNGWPAGTAMKFARYREKPRYELPSWWQRFEQATGGPP